MSDDAFIDRIRKRILCRPTGYRLAEQSVDHSRQILTMLNQLQKGLARVEGKQLRSDQTFQLVARGDQIINLMSAIEEVLTAMQVLKQEVLDKIAEQNTVIHSLATAFAAIQAKANEPGVSLDDMRNFLAGLSSNTDELKKLADAVTANTTP